MARNVKSAVAKIEAFISKPYADHGPNHRWERLVKECLGDFGHPCEGREDEVSDYAGAALRGLFSNGKDWNKRTAGEAIFIFGVADAVVAATLRLREPRQPAKTKISAKALESLS